MLETLLKRLQARLCGHKKHPLDPYEGFSLPHIKVLDLPELVCHVAEFLEPVDVACLALVSKYFWCILHHHFARLRGERGTSNHTQRFLLLNRLDGDNITLHNATITGEQSPTSAKALISYSRFMPCPDCAKFHRWRRANFRQKTFFVQDSPPKRARACWWSDGDITFYRSSVRITVVQLRLHLNGHLPARSLCHSFYDVDCLWYNRTKVLRLNGGKDVALNIRSAIGLELRPVYGPMVSGLPRFNMNTGNFRIQMRRRGMGWTLCLCPGGSFTLEIAHDCLEAIALVEYRLGEGVPSSVKRDERGNLWQLPVRRCPRCEVNARVWLRRNESSGRHQLEVERNWLLKGDFEPFKDMTYEGSGDSVRMRSRFPMELAR